MHAKLFISYSRKDSIAARKLIDAFKQLGYEVWVDWEDIPPATDWLDQVFRGIESSDAFIFFVSPDSITSEICNVEIGHAAQNNKRIIPIVLRDVQAKEANPIVRKLNWIFMRDGDDLQSALARFKDALELDFEWVAEHNRLQSHALEWHRAKETSLLLRGGELRRVRGVLKDAKGKEPDPTLLQTMFIHHSVQAERRRYTLLSAGIFALVILSMLTYTAIAQSKLATANAMEASQQAKIASENAEVALKNEREARKAQLEAEQQRELAEERARFALAQQSAARAQIYQSQPGELYTSTLLAIASLTTAPSDEASEILRKNISLLPVPVKQMRHDGQVNSLEFNAQGDLFVTAGADAQACVWKVSDGEMLFCVGSPGSVNDAIFSPDGTLLFTGDKVGHVQIVDAHDGNILHTFEAGTIVWDVDVRENGDQIAITRDDGRITLLDVASGNRKYDLQAFGSLRVASFSPDGTYIAAGSNTGNVTLWNIATGAAVASGRHKGEVRSLAFSPNSRYLVTGGVDGYAVVARLPTGQEVYRVLHEDSVEDITFNPDSSWFATVSYDRRIRLWDTDDGDERLRMSQDSFVNEVKVSSDGQWLATTGDDKTVRVWNASTGAEMFQVPLGGGGTALGFGGDGHYLVAGDESGDVNIWDMSVMPAPEYYIQFDGLTNGVRFSPSGDWFAASDGPRVWLLKPEQLSTLTVHSLTKPSIALNGDIKDVVFSSDSAWVGVSSVEGQTVIYNTQTKQSKILHRTGPQQKIVFLPDNKQVITCSLTGAVEVWDLLSFNKTAELAVDGSGALSVAVNSPYIALGMTDKISILSLDGSPMIELDSPGDHLLLQFNNDGSLLASSNSSGMIEIWKQENGVFTHVDSMLKEAVYSLAFNPNGNFLAVGSRHDVFLIDPITAEEVARIPHAGDVTDISYSADGETMATASLKVVQFWGVTGIQALKANDLIQAACLRLTSNFSETEWSNFFGDDEYRILCDGLPVP